MNHSMEFGIPVNLVATGDVVASEDCRLIGFYVSSTTNGTTLLKEGGSGGTAISGIITPAVGWHDFPARCKGGLHHTEGNILDITFFVTVGIY